MKIIFLILCLAIPFHSFSQESKGNYGCSYRNGMLIDKKRSHSYRPAIFMQASYCFGFKKPDSSGWEGNLAVAFGGHRGKVSYSFRTGWGTLNPDGISTARYIPLMAGCRFSYWRVPLLYYVAELGSKWLPDNENGNKFVFTHRETIIIRPFIRMVDYWRRWPVIQLWTEGLRKNSLKGIGIAVPICYERRKLVTCYRVFDDVRNFF